MNLKFGWKLTPTLTAGAGEALDAAVRREIAAGVPPVVMAIDDPGWIIYVQRLTAGTAVENEALLHFRLTGDYNDVPEYSLSPVEAARRTWAWHSTRWPKELDRDRVWFGVTNEPDREKPEWLARYSLELCKMALAAGVRLSVLGWSAGTPEPDAWRGPYATELLHLLRANRDRLALELHEYSLVPDTLMGTPYNPPQTINGLPGSPTVPWLLGRYTFIPQPWPSIIISEFGWAHNDAPTAAAGLPQLFGAAETVYNRPEILGLAIWTLGRGKSWEGLPAKMVDYIAPLTALRIVNASLPTDPAPPPIDPPVTPPTAVNVLANGSFEGGWTDISQSSQQPNGWRFAYQGGASPVSGQTYGEPEGVHKSAQQLPADEADRYIANGQWCYKLFAGGRPFWARLVQEIPDLPAGRYQFTWRGWLDFYRVTNKRRDYAVEMNSGRYMLKVNDAVVYGPADLLPANGTGPVYREIATAFTHPGGRLKLAAHMLAEWGISNNFFLDDWSLAAVVEPDPTPPPPPTDPPTAPSAEVLGVDVSKWQGVINWVKLKAKITADGRVPFVYIRGSYGTHRDERVDEYAPDALVADVPYGLYHYLHFFEPVKEQAATFAAVIRDHGLDLSPIVDLEDPNDGGLTVAQRADFVLSFLETLQDYLDEMGLGHAEIGIYTNFNYWRTALGAPEWGKNFLLWIANWTGRSFPLVPLPWEKDDWTFWQYSNQGDGRAYGASSTRIDLNRFNGDAADLAALRIPRKPTTPPEPPSPTLEEEIWAYGQGLVEIANMPDAALQAAMHDDGLFPLGDEVWFTIDGDRYAVQPAGRRDGATLVYYAPVGEWDAIRVVGEDDAGIEPDPPPVPVDPPAPPKPPQPRRHDLLRFMTGVTDGRLFEMRHSSGSQARHQVQDDLVNQDWYYLTKGNELSAEWEHFGLSDDGQWIMRGRDTSPGKGEMYTLYDKAGVYGSRWMPRYAAVGDVYRRDPIVRWQYKATCAIFTEKRQPSYLLLAAYYPTLTVNGIDVGEAVKLVWLDKPGHEEETYIYSAVYGLVRWGSAGRGFSEISEVHAPGQRPDNRREVIACGV